MNIVETKCIKCAGTCQASTDEVLWFKSVMEVDGVVCGKCESPTTRTLRHKIIMGYYNIQSIREATIGKVVAALFCDTPQRALQPRYDCKFDIDLNLWSIKWRGFNLYISEQGDVQPTLNACSYLDIIINLSQKRAGK